MLDSLKQAGKTISRELGRAWENLSEGWRELLSRSGEALTPFVRGKSDEADRSLATFPRWSLLSGEVEETATEVVVRVEVPGMEKEDCRVSVEGNMLCLSGEKRLERETQDSTYHLMERAYGSFRRTIPLPQNVDLDKAVASYKHGVLIVRLPKAASASARSVPVS